MLQTFTGMFQKSKAKGPTQHKGISRSAFKLPEISVNWETVS